MRSSFANNFAYYLVKKTGELCQCERQDKNKGGPEFQSDVVSVILFTSVYNIQGGWSVMLQETGHMSKVNFEQVEVLNRTYIKYETVIISW